MSDPYESVAAIAVRTSGDDPRRDRIVELGGAVLRQAEVTQRLAADAGQDGGDVLAPFLASLPPTEAIIAHDAARVDAFIRGAAGHPADTRLIDTLELARIALPCLPDHSLPALAAHLGLPACGAAGAEADAELTLHLWRALLDGIRAFPAPLLSAINGLLGADMFNPLHGLFRWAEATAASRAAPEDASDLLSLFAEGKLQAPRTPPLPEDDREALDPEAVGELFSQTGPFAAGLGPRYEHREGQIEMARHVAEALNERRHLLVEAGTGIGKSLAYLVPAVLASTTNRTPVIVSTNTKNLQSQLFENDLPLIRDALGIDFKAALIKGRMNYLCLRKLLYVLRQPDYELESGEHAVMVCMLTWATATETGDFAEAGFADQPATAALLGRVTSSGEECLSRACKHFRRCFLRRARAKSLSADIAVANHSLVFAEMGITSPALPPYAHVIFDEAHNLEQAATRHFSIEVAMPRVRFAVRRLWRPDARGGGRRRKGKREAGHGRGLAASILAQLKSGAFAGAASQQEQAANLAQTLITAADDVLPATEAFLQALGDLLVDARAGESLRIDGTPREGARWESIALSKKALVGTLGEVAGSCEALAKLLGAEEDGALPFHQESVRDLNAMALAFHEIAQDIEFVLAAADPEFVFWIERAPPAQGRFRAWAAPIQVGARLADELYAPLDTVIFSSATLTVGGSYAFLRKRLGIDRADPERVVEVNAGTPFDYLQQCQVVVPAFLPEPGERNGNYAEELGRLLADVFRTTRGRGLALFTSYDMLRRTTAVLQDTLAHDGIQILAQGTSGSRETITGIFKQDVESVLMGTHSFWEGVDVVGEALSCLVVARLPFAVHTDPIIQARCRQLEENGEDAFRGYSLPSAVIRFRQGFGRLIRHRTDRGIVIVADRRIVGKSYGSWFRKSLPTRTAAFQDRETFLAAIEAFLAEV